MKTIRATLSVPVLLLVIICFAYPSHAQDVTAAEGGYSAAAVFPSLMTWDVTYTARLRIKGVGSYSGTSQGECKFSRNGSFKCEDRTINKEYPGKYSVNLGTLSFSKVVLNSKAKRDLKRMLKNWATKIARREGASISNISVGLGKIAIQKPIFDSTTYKPNPTVIQISGKISATVNGKAETRSFNYRSRLVFSEHP